MTTTLVTCEIRPNERRSGACAAIFHRRQRIKESWQRQSKGRKRKKESECERERIPETAVCFSFCALKCGLAETSAWNNC